MGVWKSTVAEQYVPYVRPQENGNKEDVRWLELTDANGSGLKISTEQSPLSFSVLHFTTADLAAARHNFELQPRAEIILSLDAKMCGLGNSSCGPGVLEKHAVPPQNYGLHLRFCSGEQGKFPDNNDGNGGHYLLLRTGARAVWLALFRFSFPSLTMFMTKRKVASRMKKSVRRKKAGAKAG